ncbi:MAG: hypothetical protein ABEI98_09240 [Halorhabdus sp.]
MDEDATLEDFSDATDMSAGTDADRDSPGEGRRQPSATPGPERPGGNTTTAASSRQEQAAVEPAQTTYTYAPTGGVCAACGAVVDRRWNHEGTLVCADCKVW